MSENSEYVPVPVEVARDISKYYAKSQVIILAYDPVHVVTHTTTYGITAFDKENAAAGGKVATKALGSDLSKAQVFEDFHKNYDPALYKEACDILELLFRQNGCATPFLNQKVEKFMKSRGLHPRQG